MPMRPPISSIIISHPVRSHALPPLEVPKRPLSTSAVHTGRTYESLVLQSLVPLAFTLKQVGGRSDRGIDLLGHWSPPSPSVSASTNARLSIPTIVQCKAHVSRPSPSWVRELSGAISFAPLNLHGGNEDGVIGVLACKGALTLGIREAVMRSERGLVWCQVDGDGRIGSMAWNRVVGEMVGSLGVGFMYRNRGDGMVEKEMRLMKDGTLWEIENQDGGQGGEPRANSKTVRGETTSGLGWET